ncbi:MAG: arginine--tRNA ligase [Nitrospinota bacterium]
MRKAVLAIVEQALERARGEGLLRAAERPPIIVERPALEAHGDYSTNIALLLARSERRPPMEIAEALKGRMRDEEGAFDAIEVARPGFLNFFLNFDHLLRSLSEVESAGEDYGTSKVGAGERVLVEFVSANPTGPLHVGHGRNAVVGDVLARLLEAAGFRVEREYYINDAGTQWLTAGKSTFLRHFQHKRPNISIVFPEDFYPGDYITEIAESADYEFYVITPREGDAESLVEKIVVSAPQVKRVFEAGAITPPDLEISVGRGELELVEDSATFTCNLILDKIRRDLGEFRVHFDDDRLFRESSLIESGRVAAIVEKLKDQDHIYEAEGALWLRSSAFGDEKDRVVVRADGRPTYLASDIAYHAHKYERGFDRLINVWGADHHGYMPRMKAAVEMLGHPPESLQVVLIQFVNLKRGDQPVAMGKRTGEFAELSEVVREVGVDAARFFFLLRNADTALDFDLELAKQESSENPVYYVQYAHARLASLFRQAAERGYEVPRFQEAPLARLELPQERRLAREVLRFPEVVEGSALAMEPHRLPHYLVGLAKEFHVYYNHHRILTDDRELSSARLYLARCLQRVVANALRLLAVEAPEQM